MTEKKAIKIQEIKKDEEIEVYIKYENKVVEVKSDMKQAENNQLQDLDVKVMSSEPLQDLPKIWWEQNTEKPKGQETPAKENPE